MSAHDVWMFNINQLLPSVGREGFRNVNMALLTEGGTASQRVYKHGPPDGGSKQPIHRLPSSDVLVTRPTINYTRSGQSQPTEGRGDQPQHHGHSATDYSVAGAGTTFGDGQKSQSTATCAQFGKAVCRTVSSACRKRRTRQNSLGDMPTSRANN